MDQRRDRKQVCVLMLDCILWFGFGAILIFPYGVWCGAKWSGGYKGGVLDFLKLFLRVIHGQLVRSADTKKYVINFRGVLRHLQT